MKRILFAAMVLCASVSCKKDGAPAPKEHLLTKIFENDILEYEFEYSSGKKLQRSRQYYTGSGALMYEDAYEYDGKGYPKQKMRTNSNGDKYLYKYECNSAGYIIKNSIIPQQGQDSGKVTSWKSYTYNARNQVITINHYEDANTPEGYEALEYAANGSLYTLKVFIEAPGGPELFLAWKFTGTTNRIGNGLRKAFVEPERTDFTFFDANSITVTRYSNNMAQQVYNYTMTNRHSEIAGQLAQQTIASKQTFPSATTPDVNNMRYEYVEK
jgi:hypothetical protein